MDSNDSLVQSGHEQLARGDWRAARESFQQACAGLETAEALEGLGMAAWWLDETETVFDARERAYLAYQERGDRRGAGRVAITLAMDALQFRGQPAVATGWQRRASSLLAELPASAEHAWLRLCQCELALATGEDAGRVSNLAAEAVSIARVLGDPDVEVVALSMEGLALVVQGAIDQGMPRLDEAAAAALSGDLDDPLAIGICCCHLLSACELVRDFGRASEWCERVREYSTRFKSDVMLAVCRATHAEVLMWSGDWTEAEAELSRSVQQLAVARPPQQEHVLVRLAELRRRQGRFDEAHELLKKLQWHPHQHLVRARIALDHEDAAAACESARRFLEQTPRSHKIDRALAAELLLQAEVALGRAPALQLLEEIRELGAGLGTDPLRALVHATEAVVAAAGGEHERAGAEFDRAIGLLARSGACYEPARLRVELARCLLVANREEAACQRVPRSAEI